MSESKKESRKWQLTVTLAITATVLALGLIITELCHESHSALTFLSWWGNFQTYLAGIYVVGNVAQKALTKKEINDG